MPPVPFYGTDYGDVAGDVAARDCCSAFSHHHQQPASGAGLLTAGSAKLQREQASWGRMHLAGAASLPSWLPLCGPVRAGQQPHLLHFGGEAGAHTFTHSLTHTHTHAHMHTRTHSCTCAHSHTQAMSKANTCAVWNTTDPTTYSCTAIDQSNRTVDLPHYCCWQGVYCCTTNSTCCMYGSPGCSVGNGNGLNCGCVFGTVTEIRKRRNNITGALPALLEPLYGMSCNLRNLQFQFNQISSSIPSSITQLPQLGILVLSYNSECTATDGVSW